MKVDISDSSMLGLREEEKESKDVTHVFVSLMMAIVDLTWDRFLEIVEKVTSPMIVSSPAQVNSKGAISSNSPFFVG